jgi:predicted DNA-binding transcriptional regulator YafY
MQAIDHALRAERWPTDKTLAADLEVDPRTIRRDLEFMRDEHHAPIEFDRVRRGYYYADPTFRLPLVQTGQGEMLALYSLRPGRPLEGEQQQGRRRDAR